MFLYCGCYVLFFKQKTAYEMRISDWSSDVCSSDLIWGVVSRPDFWTGLRVNILGREAVVRRERGHRSDETNGIASSLGLRGVRDARWILAPPDPEINCSWKPCRSEEHTSELQSLMRILYAVFCLNKKTLPHGTR